ncbi:MAG: hypothetical protein BMS9Abin29_2575 [Gemmatimonadota bacterium]|nr:MAG: hypothetical protein BMS9Abin29_2575 [Gemmatimonadota bacterium]
MDRNGYSLVEMIMSMLLLTSGILGMGTTAGRITMAAQSAKARSEALQSVKDGLDLITIDPRYAKLDSIYAGTETELPGMESFVRTTAVNHVEQLVTGGGRIDYKEITVRVTGPGVEKGISRTAVVAAP